VLSTTCATYVGRQGVCFSLIAMEFKMREFYPPISRRISDIYKGYYEEKARGKYDCLVNHAKEYVDALSLNDNFSHFIDPFRFYALVRSYYLDVIRYKEYHFDKKRRDGDPDDSIDCYSKEWSEYVHKKLISKDKAASLKANWIINHYGLKVHSLED